MLILHSNLLFFQARVSRLISMSTSLDSMVSHFSSLNYHPGFPWPHCCPLSRFTNSKVKWNPLHLTLFILRVLCIVIENHINMPTDSATDVWFLNPGTHSYLAYSDLPGYPCTLFIVLNFIVSTSHRHFQPMALPITLERKYWSSNLAPFFHF